jgi:hypothetical protein
LFDIPKGKGKVCGMKMNAKLLLPILLFFASCADYAEELPCPAWINNDDMCEYMINTGMLDVMDECPKCGYPIEDILISWDLMYND